MKLIFYSDAVERLGGEHNIRQAVHALRTTHRRQCFGHMVVGDTQACAYGAVLELFPSLKAPTGVGISPDDPKLPPGMNRPFCDATGYLRWSFKDNKAQSKTSASIISLNDRFRLSFAVIANVLEAVAERHEDYEVTNIRQAFF